MKRCQRLIALVWIVPALSGCAQGVAAPDAAKKESSKVAFSSGVAPLLKKYCVGCHGGAKPKADLALDAYKDDASALKDRGVWEKVARKLRDREMPPANKPQPAQAEIDLITRWIDVELAKVDCTGKRDPGRVTIRRLNRAEYNNTIRDLVGVHFQPAEDFPADDVGYGFDNIGDVLSLPPMLMEKYLAAAEKITDLAFKTPEARRRIMIADPADKGKTEAARKIIENFATRAYRRPATADELARLLKLVDLAEKNGDSFEAGIRLAMQAVLVSPHFLFKIELDQEPNNPAAVHLITEFELATRLSYFLWSSMPDDQLFALARNGNLRKEGNVEAQVKRMLQDPKARALVENFAGQWLLIRNLKAFTPDPEAFPSFDETLRSSMIRETELFFEAIMKEDRNILDFLDANFTFVDQRLARHYGISGIRGTQFRKVTLEGDQRGGILTHASILTVTSNPTRTSPVKRGKYILENILGTPPPPPPPDVPELSEEKKIVESLPLRQRMETHRSNPNCAVCHQRMDPLGFALENFDGVGAWRTKDGKFDIDASGVLPTGESFKSPAELRAVLKKKEDAFRRCLTEKMLTYALGRGLEYYDKCAVDDSNKALAKDGNKFSVLVLEIVKSDPFQKRRGKKGDANAAR